MIELAKDSSLPFSERLERIRSSAFALQNLYDEGEIFDMDNISYEDESTISLEYAMSGLSTLLELEVLEELVKRYPIGITIQQNNFQRMQPLFLKRY